MSKKIRRMNKWFYLVTFLSPIILGVILIIFVTLVPEEYLMHGRLEDIFGIIIEEHLSELKVFLSILPPY